MDWMKFRPLYLIISGIALAASIYAIAVWGFRLAIDFTGGSVTEYHFATTPDRGKVEGTIREDSGDNVKDIRWLSNGNVETRFGLGFNQEKAKSIADDIEKKDGVKADIFRYEEVGPTFSQEIFKKTLYAVLLTSIGILIFIGLQFKDWRFGAFAIVALAHDLIILLGTFAFLGHFEHVEVDILVVTAFLTTFSLSLYDTIVVYDRLRESLRKHAGEPFVQIANRSITETIVRSLNTSLTSVFLLLALFLLGGTSIKWFTLALLIGVISGTYSSPFVAVPLIVTWDSLRKRFRK
jgi:preprotein translocase subunit SecF